MTRFSWLVSLFSLLLTLGVGQALALERPFPENAKRGIFQMKTFPDVLVDNKPRRLSPAAQIRNTDNLLVLQGNVAHDAVLVNYTEDLQGEILKVWILTPDEAKQPRPAKKQAF